jgi:dihydrofolate reductase/thymidylate synthase
VRAQLVVAATPSWGIGKDGKLPWALPGDLAFFKALTCSVSEPGGVNAVLMGRSTWLSLPPKFRPLPSRLNVVISASGALRAHGKPPSNAPAPRFPPSSVRALTGAPAAADAPGDGAALPEGVLLAASLEAALEALPVRVETAYVIGGARLYEEALASPRCEAVHLTAVELMPDPVCDVHAPALGLALATGGSFALWSASSPQRAPGGEAAGRFTFLHYVRRGAEAPPVSFGSRGSPVAPHEERQYLGLIADIMAQGATRGDRTGTGTLSLFGRQMRFDLRRSFPLLTTKRVFWRGVAEELLWFVSGSTDARRLRDKDIHIWDGNGSRAFLDGAGLGHREEWDLGPVYGFQWRHFGAPYSDMHADYAGAGVDQLAEVVRKLRHAPHDRRIVLSAWNPAALAEMALPPCHMFAQFYVAGGELSCLMYQRSCDMGLGVPFNIASYALLTRMLAHVSGACPRHCAPARRAACARARGQRPACLC